MMMGANIATIIVMLLVGFSDHLHPEQHPLLSTVGMAFPFFVVANLAFLVFWLIFKWTKAWIPVVGFLLAYVPISIYLPFHPQGEIPEETVKMLSYNVCGYGFNGKESNDFETIINYVRDQQADIVCMQEDNDTWRKIEFKEFEKIGLVHNDTVMVSKSIKAANGLGIHTRYPILRREKIPYGTAVNNGSVAWWLKIGRDTVVVINNHFESCHLTKADRQQYKQILKGEVERDSLRAESKLLLVKLAEANAKRSLQIDKVCRYVEQCLQQGYPIILCGDFNDNPISYAHHTVSQLLTDCYVATGRGVGLSYNQKGFFFRIDHIFCSEDIQPYNCEIDGKIDASDHYPVVCWLKIRGNS